MRYTLMLILAVSLLACAPQTSPAHPIITAYTDAYNAKDIEAMRALMHPDIEWLSVNGADVTIEVAGKEGLSKTLESFFKDPNMATGAHRDWSINGNIVAVTEIARWKNAKGEVKEQSALTVYELKDGLIRRVYYYSAT